MHDFVCPLPFTFIYGKLSQTLDCIEIMLHHIFKKMFKELTISAEFPVSRTSIASSDADMFHIFEALQFPVYEWFLSFFTYFQAAVFKGHLQRFVFLRVKNFLCILPVPLEVRVTKNCRSAIVPSTNHLR